MLYVALVRIDQSYKDHLSLADADYQKKLLFEKLNREAWEFLHCTLNELTFCVYQTVHGSLIPLVPLDALVLHCLLQLVKDVVLVFAFVFSHKASKLLLQSLPGNLKGGDLAKQIEEKAGFVCNQCI